MKDNNSINFDADIKDNGVLSFATNYSEYFEIYVDGIKVPTKTVNKYFLGCDITKGNHNIKVVYHNTLIKKSMCVTLLGCFILFTIIIYDKKKIALISKK